jgi:hypothetical protein
MKSRPLQRPLIVIADNTRSQIKERLGNISTLQGNEDQRSNADQFPEGNLPIGSIDLYWNEDRDSAPYIQKAKGRRTLFLLDLAWPSEPKRGIAIAQDILDSHAAEHCIILFKSVDHPAFAEDFKSTSVRLIRTLRSCTSVTEGRVRTLAANTDPLLRNAYEEGEIAQALLDLQEEAIFDALHQGAWSVDEVDCAIDQLREAAFYGAFSKNKKLEQLYADRVLGKYRQRFRPDYSKGSLNLGVAQLMGEAAPVSCCALRDQLEKRAPESVALVSGLIDYTEIAAVESFFFQLGKPQSKTGKEIAKTTLQDAGQAWKADRWQKAGVTLRKLDGVRIRRACESLRTIVAAIGLPDEPLSKLSEALKPAQLRPTAQSLLSIHNILAETRSKALCTLRSPPRLLLESVFNEIEVEFSASPPNTTDGMASPPEFVILDWEFGDEEASRADYTGKRTRLLNRNLFVHPAVEAARLVRESDSGGAEKRPEAIVSALRTYIQSPEAIAALAELRHADAQEFSRCIVSLAAESSNFRFPLNFEAFDKFWKWHNGREPKALLPALQSANTDLFAAIETWNAHNGQKDPVHFSAATLLELLVAHLSLLEFRLGSFCTLIGHDVINAQGGKEKKIAAAKQEAQTTKIALKAATRTVKEVRAAAAGEGVTAEEVVAIAQGVAKGAAMELKAADSKEKFTIKSDTLFQNISDLWRSRSWHDIFSKREVLKNAGWFTPDLPWAGDGGLLSALCKESSTAEEDCGRYRSWLSQFDINTVGGELSYGKIMPQWLRIGNLALPLDVIDNLCQVEASNLISYDDNKAPSKLAASGSLYQPGEGEEAERDRAESETPTYEQVLARSRLKAIQAGDQSACKVFIEMNRRGIEALAKSMCRGTAIDPEDLFQEGAIACLHSVKQLPPDFSGDVNTYARHAASGAMRSYIQRERRRLDVTPLKELDHGEA